MSKVNPIPDGYTTVTPYITVKDAASALKFYAKAFGATELFRMPGPDGSTVMHAEMQLGSGRFMLSEEFPMEGVSKSPKALNGTTVTVHLYFEDADAAHKRAVDAGAKSLMPPTDMFWGDRFAKVEDPYGHHWSIATHVNDLTPEEIAEGMKKAFDEGCG